MSILSCRNPGLGFRLARGDASGKLRYFGENQGALQASIPPRGVFAPLRGKDPVRLSHPEGAENFHMELSKGFKRILKGLIRAPLSPKDCL